MSDYQSMTDEQLRAVIEEVSAVLTRRAALAAAPSTIDNALRAAAEAEGVTEGGQWVPTTLGYPEGWIVTHNGRTYRSLIRANVWEPGDTSDPQYYRWWEDITPAPEPDPGTTPAWDGEGHVYAVGDVVTYQGTEYECVQAHTSQPSWTPPDVLALWQPVEGEG